MYCAHLSLTNFRNYTRLELDLPTDVTIVVGDNAQGKSNLLEAFSLLATTKSFRASSDRELINWNVAGTEFSFARLVGQFYRSQSRQTVELAIREVPASTVNGSGSTVAKRVKLNDIPRRAIDVLGTALVVMFTPHDVDLVNGAPAVRRRYLDVTLSQVDPRYCRALAHYNRVVEQRNHLLRQIRDRRARLDQLHFWDQEMARSGGYIVAARERTVALLSNLAHGFHRQLTGHEERLTVDYRSSLENAIADSGGSHFGPLDDTTSPSDDRPTAIAGRFQTFLSLQRDRDVAMGMSLVGPHRDDLHFRVDGRNMNTFGSRGQQRTVALALKLAEARYLADQSGELPILLLDDVMSELDAHRREHVLRTIAPGQQVLMTTTDLEALSPEFLHAAAVYRVERGAVATVRSGAQSSEGLLRRRLP